MYLKGGQVTISQCEIFDFSATYGGAFYILEGGQLRLKSVLARNNQAAYGGVVWLSGSDSSANATMFKAVEMIGFENTAYSGGGVVYHDSPSCTSECSIVKVVCGNISSGIDGNVAVGSVYKDSTNSCAGPTLQPTTWAPTMAPTLYPSPAPTTMQPTANVILVTVSNQLQLDGISADDIGKGAAVIIKQALANSTGVSTENLYNLEFTDASERRRQLESMPVHESLGGETSSVSDTSADSQRRKLATSTTLVSFDIIYDLLMTNYSTSGRLYQALEGAVADAVDSGELVDTISRIERQMTSGNAVLSSATLTASAAVSTYTTTDADAVTFAPTAFYGYCPPLYMSPIQLAEYMTTVLCVDTDTPQRLSDDLCTYLNDMRNKTFPERRCALTASPMAR